MKIKSFLFIAVATILFSGGCAQKESFDLKMTIEPVPGVQTNRLINFGETGRIIKKRLINLGVDSEKIDIRTFADRMILTIAKADTSKIESIEKVITVPGNIGFWETYENSEIFTDLIKANNHLGEMKLRNIGVAEDKAKETAVKDTSLNENPEITDIINADTTGTASRKEYNAHNPLLGILMPNVDADGQPRPSCMVGLAALKDTATVNRYLGMEEIKSLSPRDLKFCWSHAPYKYDQTESLYELHALKITGIDGQPPLMGDVITSVKAITSKNRSDVLLDLTMNHEGAMKWEAITKENINRCIAVVIDGYVRSYPRVMNEIAGGNTEITGNFSVAEAQYLSAILSTGGDVLPLKLQVAEKQIIKIK